MGKGSSPRPLGVSRKTFSENFERTLGNKEPIPLCRQGTDEVIAYACGKCGTVTSSVRNHGDEALQLAEDHCGPWWCTKCGEEKTRFNCWNCINAASRERDKNASRERDKKRLEEAEDVTASYSGPVSDDNTHFWPAPEEAACDIDAPAWLYTCTVSRLSLDARNILESALEDHHDNAWEELLGEDELQKLLDAWCEKQTMETWTTDYSRKVYVIPVDWEPCLGEDE